MELPANDGVQLLSYALNKEQDDRLFMRWIGQAQYQMSFDEFKQSLIPVRIDTKKTMEQLDELMENTKWTKVPNQGW
jgi:hypothetical protein